MAPSVSFTTTSTPRPFITKSSTWYPGLSQATISAPITMAEATWETTANVKPTSSPPSLESLLSSSSFATVTEEDLHTTSSGRNSTAVSEVLATGSTIINKLFSAFSEVLTTIATEVSSGLYHQYHRPGTASPVDFYYPLPVDNFTASALNNSTTMNYMNSSGILSAGGGELHGGAQYRLASDSDINISATNASFDLIASPGSRPPFHQSCLLFDFLIEAVVMGILCACGFTGNTLSMICMWRDKSKTATPFLLVSLELADTMFLVTVLLLRVLTSIHGFTGWLESVMSVFIYIGSYVYAFALIAETGSIYLTILVTVNRYISVCRPYEASDLCSIYHARRHVVLVAAFSILFNLPRFFEYSIVHLPHPQTNRTSPRAVMTDFAQSIIYQVLYANMLYFLVMFAVPLVTLICLNYKLIKALRKTKKKRAKLISSSTLDSQSKSEDDITLVLIVVVMVFVISQTPALITQSLFSFLPAETRICPNAFFYYERISDLMVVSNASMNFIIYCFCSTRFRHILRNLLCKQLPESPDASAVTRSTKVRTLKGRSGKDSMV